VFDKIVDDHLERIKIVRGCFDRRDGRLADGINSIGESSPEAKEKVLSGRGNISRTRLQELSSGTDSEINKAADMIINGIHAARRSGKAKEQFEQLSIEGFVSQIAYDINSKIKNLGGDTENSKTTLRALITELEALYRRL
jgi:hypothetical protein